MNDLAIIIGLALIVGFRLGVIWQMWREWEFWNHSIMLLLTAGLLACSPSGLQAAEPTPPILPAPPTKLFRENEFNLELGGTARIDNDKRTKDDVDIGGSIGANYWVTRHLGLGVRGESEDTRHSVVDRAIARLQTRAPLWDTVAPYGYVEGGFDFERNQWGAGAGGGIEWRPKAMLLGRIGIYAEAGLEVTQLGHGRMRGAAGVRLPF